MGGLNISILIKGGDKLVKALNSSSTIKKPMGDGIRRITLYYNGLVKKATVVDTGRLRASIKTEINPTRAAVGTNVKYAPFIEFGTRHMEARHMEGSRRTLGKGMFTYAWGLLLTWLGDDKHNIHKDIDKEFK